MSSRLTVHNQPEKVCLASFRQSHKWHELYLKIMAKMGCLILTDYLTIGKKD